MLTETEVPTWAVGDYLDWLNAQPENLRGKELLSATLEVITKFPERWNQAQWRCGTAGCFAGNAAVVANVRYHDLQDVTDGMVIVPTDIRQQIGEDKAHVSTTAQALLGLSGFEASMLFSASNSFERVKAIVEAILDGTIHDTVMHYGTAASDYYDDDDGQSHYQGDTRGDEYVWSVGTGYAIFARRGDVEA